MNILFIHGFAGGRFEYAPLLFLAKKYGHTVLEYTYSDCFGQCSLATISTRIHEFCQMHSFDVDAIVGFSQGGVIGTHYANVFCQTSIRIFTLCSPFWGSLMAYILPFPGIKELRFGSSFLRNVQQESKHHIYSIWTPFDLMVFPGWSAMGPGENYVIFCPIHTFFVSMWPKTKRIFLEKILKQANSPKLTIKRKPSKK
jgi:triacylglycerol lipase